MEDKYVDLYTFVNHFRETTRSEVGISENKEKLLDDLLYSSPNLFVSLSEHHLSSPEEFKAFLRRHMEEFVMDFDEPNGVVSRFRLMSLLDAMSLIFDTSSDFEALGDTYTKTVERIAVNTSDKAVLQRAFGRVSAEKKVSVDSLDEKDLTTMATKFYNTTMCSFRTASENFHDCDPLSTKLYNWVLSSGIRTACHLRGVKSHTSDSDENVLQNWANTAEYIAPKVLSETARATVLMDRIMAANFRFARFGTCYDILIMLQDLFKLIERQQIASGRQAMYILRGVGALAAQWGFDPLAIDCILAELRLSMDNDPTKFEVIMSKINKMTYYSLSEPLKPENITKNLQMSSMTPLNAVRCMMVALRDSFQDAVVAEEPDDLFPSEMKDRFLKHYIYMSAAHLTANVTVESYGTGSENFCIFKCGQVSMTSNENPEVIGDTDTCMEKMRSKYNDTCDAISEGLPTRDTGMPIFLDKRKDMGRFTIDELKVIAAFRAQSDLWLHRTSDGKVAK